MKYLLYSPNYWPEPVGIGKYNHELASWLASHGHDVTVVTAMPHYPDWRVDRRYLGKAWHQENHDGANILRVPVSLATGGAPSTLGRLRLETSFAMLSWRWWFPALVSRDRVDAVVAVLPPLQDAHIPLLYSRIRGVPLLVHVQDLQVDAALNLGMLPQGPAATVLHAWERAALASSTWVSTITEEMRDRIVAKGVRASKTTVIPNWADTDFVCPQPRDTDVRSRLGAGPDQTLAIYSGSMGEKQGLESVLRAAARLQQDHRFRFALVGAGAARQRLEAEAAALRLNNVVFRDVYPWGRVPELLAAADVHLVVQKREASGLVMPSKTTNILASGRPMIATADPGTALHNLVLSSGAGFVCDPDNPEALVATLMEAASRPADLEAMGGKARAYAVSELGKDRILSRFEALLESLTMRR